MVNKYVKSAHFGGLYASNVKTAERSSVESSPSVCTRSDLIFLVPNFTQQFSGISPSSETWMRKNGHFWSFCCTVLETVEGMAQTLLTLWSAEAIIECHVQ